MTPQHRNAKSSRPKKIKSHTRSWPEISHSKMGPSTKVDILLWFCLNLFLTGYGPYTMCIDGYWLLSLCCYCLFINLLDVYWWLVLSRCYWCFLLFIDVCWCFSCLNWFLSRILLFMMCIDVYCINMYQFNLSWSSYGDFHKWMYPIAGWFIMENPIYKSLV